MKAGLQRDGEPIELDQVMSVQNLAFTLLEQAPLDPEIENFEEYFTRNPFSAAQATLRGSAIELFTLCLILLSKNRGTSRAATPHTALQALPEIARALSAQIEDRSPSGRIPRAILGRYLGWISHYEPDWTRDHFDQIFPVTDGTLRQAAWLAHLLHSDLPVEELYTELQQCYVDELRHLTTHTHDSNKVSFRQKQFSKHLLILYLRNTFQIDDELFSQFLRSAPSELRRVVMWNLGQFLKLPPNQFPQEARCRALAYWEARLTVATTDSKPDLYREELEGIDLWVSNPQLETSWLLEQLLTMLDAGFAPCLDSDILEWLSDVCTQDADRSIRILAALIHNPRCSSGKYMVWPRAIRKILTVAAANESVDIVNLVNQTVSILSTKGGAEFLDLAQRN